MRLTSVIASLSSGGIGPVCLYAVLGMAKVTDWQLTLLAIHDPVSDEIDPENGIRRVGLGLDSDCARAFIRWLNENPQDVVITSDVSRIESAFRFIPIDTRHIVQIHDSGRRYREVAVRNATWIDGVICVGKHIEAPLRQSLDNVGFKGLLRTIHNGADFPQLSDRKSHAGPLRLLFMGRLEAMKGVFDLVPLLLQLRRFDIPVTLNIVGGENAALRRQFERKGLGDLVIWSGRVPHSRCYEVASASDIFLMTSRKESFGMVTIEAMSMGCVPIAYDVPCGSTEIIEHGKSGLLVPMGNIVGWAERIRELHLERERFAELSAGAIDRARGAFSAEVMVGNMVEFIGGTRIHAEENPSSRHDGLPPASTTAVPTSGYQRLPLGLRDWIRKVVYSIPRLSLWLLNR
ncbi:MAG: glycosyltransferase family 4 protein [Armatimonadetes bacterium]|nr:glycosyltransferase family 4 protein [Akkermansiaceae bacterium]